MLFNSYVFLFCFLPVVLFGFLFVSRFLGNHWRIGWLFAASLFFYAWWNPSYLILIGASIAFNYLIGWCFSGLPRQWHKVALTLGVVVNLSALGFFKYANFFVDNVNELLGSNYHLRTIILPLAISFFTFQQIAYLVDAYRAGGLRYGFLEYALFVSFFPQLIAGPIVHHHDIMPQLGRLRVDCQTLAIGVTMFSMGLFKKLFVADSLIPAVDGTFQASTTGTLITFADAWMAALAYAMQLYFDFSGYSDMAIGLAALFGVALPFNFNSPYKATSIISFWRRWHMTLSRFLRDYVYIALGGNRKGPIRRYINLMITMLLGGLWHGAGWTFVLWGGIHGAYLILNQLFKSLSLERDADSAQWIRVWIARLTTFLAVLLAWVVFRADSLSSAFTLLGTMLGSEGLSFELLRTPDETLPWILGALALVAWGPNTQEIIYASERPDCLESTPKARRWQWQPNFSWALASAAMLVISVVSLSELSEFLYFQF